MTERNASEQIEIVGEAWFVHVNEAHVSDYGAKLGIKPSYSLQLAIKKGSKEWGKLVHAAKTVLGVDKIGLKELRAKDGDKETSKKGNPLSPGNWLITVSSQFPIPVVDADAKPLTLKEEPGDGSLMNVGITVKAGTDRDTDRPQAVIYLAGVQVLDLKENNAPKPYVFGAYTQQAVSNDGGIVDAADAF